MHTPVNITRSQPTTLLPTVHIYNSTNISLAQPTVSTPVNIGRLCSLLAAHPDKSFANYVSLGMSCGFDVGFRDSTPVRAGLSSSPNHPSALRNKQFVSLYLKSCCESGLTAGPFSSPPFSSMFVSGLGIVPKKNGKLRVIHDLSSPDGSSVNDGISRDDFSPDYATVDMAVSHIMSLGRRSKTDQSAKGFTLNIGSSPEKAVCPVQAMRHYLAQVQSTRPNQLFVYGSGFPLAKLDISREIRNLLPLCGVACPEMYTSHSLRIGAATTAAIAGVPEHLIRHMGRWKSDAVLKYIRVAKHRCITALCKTIYYSLG